MYSEEIKQVKNTSTQSSDTLFSSILKRLLEEISTLECEVYEIEKIIVDVRDDSFNTKKSRSIEEKATESDPITLESKFYKIINRLSESNYKLIENKQMLKAIF